MAAEFIPRIAATLSALGVELRGDPTFCGYAPVAKPATEADWHAEYLELILACRVVDDIDAAIAHINRYCSLHTESIITSYYSRAQRFIREVNPPVSWSNASTRFADGGQLGLGAEIGISTTNCLLRPDWAGDLTTTSSSYNGDGRSGNKCLQKTFLTTKRRHVMTIPEQIHHPRSRPLSVCRASTNRQNYGNKVLALLSAERQKSHSGQSQ